MGMQCLKQQDLIIWYKQANQASIKTAKTEMLENIRNLKLQQQNKPCMVTNQNFIACTQWRILFPVKPTLITCKMKYWCPWNKKAMSVADVH